MVRRSLGAERIQSGSGLSSPLLSPEGKYVFYLSGSHLWRMKAIRGETPIKLSNRLPGVRSFAISR